MFYVHMHRCLGKLFGIHVSECEVTTFLGKLFGEIFWVTCILPGKKVTLQALFGFESLLSFCFTKKRVKTDICKKEHVLQILGIFKF